MLDGKTQGRCPFLGRENARLNRSISSLHTSKFHSKGCLDLFTRPSKLCSGLFRHSCQESHEEKDVHQKTPIAVVITSKSIWTFFYQKIVQQKLPPFAVLSTLRWCYIFPQSLKFLLWLRFLVLVIIWLVLEEPLINVMMHAKPKL